MKKIFVLCCLLTLILGIASCEITNEVPIITDPYEFVSPYGPKEENKHLILNKDGSYGGTLNEELYGKGAPLNGELDVKDSIYYNKTDYYNMPSTLTRTIMPNFAPYQQTMADSSGLACALMILNYCKEDINETFTEEKLVKMYEELNETTVYGNGTSALGLEKVFNNLGYDTRSIDYVEKGSTTALKTEAFSAWTKNHLDNGRLIMVRFNDGDSYNWHIIIGIDTMGTDLARDDVLIMADPFDNLDHHQDGYYMISASRFYRWWMEVADSGEVVDEFDYLIVCPKRLVKHTRVEKDTMPLNIVPERHLLLNEDGSFGGTRNEELYGVIPEINGTLDHLDKSYYAMPDYYNLTSNETRLLLTNFRAFQQTMASSCGICSTLMVLNYYGEDVSVYDEVYLVNKYEELNGKTVKGNGVGSTGLKKLVDFLGYNGVADSFNVTSYVNEESKLFKNYNEFLRFVQTNIAKGTPIPVSWKPINGHWEVIIGIDTMGTDDIHDDVIILADSHDTFDHYQDGYNTLPAIHFYRQWCNSSHTYNQQYCLFDKVN